MLRTINENNTGEYILELPFENKALQLVDFIITISQGQGQDTGAKLCFRDDENTVTIFKQYIHIDKLT